MRNPKSQVSGSSYSPTSQFSEPPDIKKWFSSYTYESPELDTYGLSHKVNDEERELYVEDSEAKEEGECEGFTQINRYVAFRKSTEEARKLAFPSLPNVEVPACSDSLSLPSEPPDITKWFSSYVYESPVLDSADFDVSRLNGSSFGDKKGIDKGREDHIKEFPVTEVRDEVLICRETITGPGGVENNKIPSAPQVFSIELQVPAYPNSLSLPSEPPDITNWFSSYVYESPELDSADRNVSLSSGNTFGDMKEVEVVKGRKDHLKELPVTIVGDEILSCSKEAITRLGGVENNKNLSTPQVLSFDYQEDGSDRNLSTKNSLCLKRTSDQITSGVELNDCDTLPDKSVVCPRIREQDPSPILHDEQQQRSINHFRSPAKAPYSRGRGITETGEEKTENKSISAENDSGWILLNRKPREEYYRSITNQRKEYIAAENLFSLRVNKALPRIDKENSPVKSVCSADRQKNKVLRKEILKETTNFDLSHVPEVAGKWKCPQKYKPNNGPPLKQLRLERWVRKI